MSPQQQEPRFLNLHLEYISPLKGPRLFGEHDLFFILGRKKKENTMYLDHSFMARKQGWFYSMKDSARWAKEMLKGLVFSQKL